MSFRTGKSLFALTAAACLVPGSGGRPARADYTVQVNKDDVRTASFDGWGCSLCWWANQFGGSTSANALADLCFSTNTVNWQGTALPGLGINIVRYNVGGGGGGATIDAGTVEKVSPAMPAFKNLRGFQRNWYSSDPASSSWDWNLDAAQRTMMQKAVSRGVNLVEFFSNAPPWWMCYNHSTAGSDGGGDNLQNWNYGTFAAYLATTAKYAQDNWGVQAAYIEPFNEPSAGWWKYAKDQEGCHFDASTQQAVVPSLRAALDSRGLQSVGVTASDENDIDTARTTWNGFSASVQNAVSKVNAHGYSGLSPYRGNGRGPLRQAVGSRKLWMSEYGDTDASGLTMADSMMRDMTEMRADGWVYWQPFDSGAWGLIQSNPGDNWIGGANRKWYVFAQFSRHIRPGYRILGSGDSNSIIAYSPTAHKLEIVTANFGTAQWINYNLSAFAALGAVQRWTTTTAPGGTIPDLKYQNGQDVVLTNKTFRYYSYPNSVTTFEIAGTFADPVSVSGTVTLEGRTHAAQPLTFQFRPMDGSAAFTANVAPTANGSFILNGVLPKRYNVAVKGAQWLQKVIPVDASGGSVSNLNVSLAGGDANNDNVVDIGDFGILVNAYNSNAAIPGSGYDIRADFNGDGTVDIADFGILVNNYGLSGDW